jgi:VWFA-related protein
VIPRPAVGCAAVLTVGLLLATADAAKGVDGRPAALPAEPGEHLVMPPPPATPEAFLAEAELLITPAERTVYARLQQPYQREQFMRRFWAVRDPYPQTPQNELEERWRTRYAQAADRYEAGDDRRKVWTLLGEPAHVERGTCTDWLLPLELWRYGRTQGMGGEITLVFYPAQGRRYTVFDAAQGLRRIVDGMTTAGLSEAQVAQAVAAGCLQGQELIGALANAPGLATLSAIPALVPKPNPEWVRAFVVYSTDVPEGAAALPARLDLRFPGRFQSRTVVQGAVVVEPREAQPTSGPGASYSFAVDGEILRQDVLFDQFRYRFAFPAGATSLPLVFERRLRPGSYRLVLRVQDTVGERYFRTDQALEVPLVESSPPPLSAPVAVAAGSGEGQVASGGDLGTRLAEADAALGTGDWTLELWAPQAVLQVGKVRVEARTTGDGIAEVRFTLDGRPLMTKRRPPYSVEVDLGARPQLHSLGAESRAADGRLLARDEVLLNAGSQRFAVRLLSPERGQTYSQSLRAQAEVEVPGGEDLDRLELYLNDRLLATLYQPPFVQPIVLPPASEVTYVRAVAYLASGRTAEELVFVNAPDFQAEVNIQLVELYTSFFDRRGRPVGDLRRDEVGVEEDGKPQMIERFEPVVDRPIHAGLILDTSSSMFEELPEVEKAALRFFRDVLRPQDRAALVTFADQPRLAVRLTNDVEVLAGGLAGMVAEGQTALYDSLVFSLHYFGGLTGKRSLILLTDGEDVNSRYKYEDVVDYARRLGIAIYPIGMDLTTRQNLARGRLLELAAETGGHAYFIAKASELGAIYQQIEEELRAQLLIAYQSTGEGPADRFRTVAVAVRRPGVVARTIPGYYP